MSHRRCLCHRIIPAKPNRVLSNLPPVRNLQRAYLFSPGLGSVSHPAPSCRTLYRPGGRFEVGPATRTLLLKKRPLVMSHQAGNTHSLPSRSKPALTTRVERKLQDVPNIHELLLAFRRHPFPLPRLLPKHLQRDVDDRFTFRLFSMTPHFVPPLDPSGLYIATPGRTYCPAVRFSIHLAPNKHRRNPEANADPDRPSIHRSSPAKTLLTLDLPIPRTNAQVGEKEVVSTLQGGLGAEYSRITVPR